MSTRSTVHFTDDWSKAIVYKHSDGYPDGEHGMLAVFKAFFKWNEKRYGKPPSHGGLRYSDPSYLAARFVAFLADDDYYREHGLGIGIVQEDPTDIEYRYTLAASNGRPDVKVEEIH